ncbi:MAG: hypothetical protein CVU84_14580 [Firmicutes bacterium HGW-Firmicutes-1]|nr:MAG: hypothetical protein CVU84_14580 [Firmicutes bacterium HGW-Firmicutes-1]
MNINLSVPMVYEEDYVKKIIELNKNRKKITTKIYEVYGSLKEDIIGNLRPAETLKDVSKEKMKELIDVLHSNNIKFNYTMNATVSDGREYSSGGRKEILKFIDSLIRIGIDSFTITSPYLIRLIKEHFKDANITASICNEIDTVQKAKQFEDIGVSCIVLNRDINRDFKMLKSIKEKNNCDIKVLCTTPCIYRCMDVYYHSNLSSTMSNELKKAMKISTKEFSHTSVNCLYKKINNLYENIKSPWIRPEDMKYYAEIGINYFKIDGRDKTAEYNLDVIKSYLDECFEGNLLYLMNDGYPKDMIQIANKLDVAYLKMGINNSSLNSFLQPFVNGSMNCRDGCDICKYCEKIAEKEVKVNEEWRDIFLQYLKCENRRRLEAN